MEADRLGYDSVWTAESYGSDALTPLAWWGSQTERVRLGDVTVPTVGVYADGDGDGGPDAGPSLRRPLRARPGGLGPPGGRGRTASPFPAPLARTREYVDIVRQVLAREKPVTNDGPHYPLPYPGGTGLGKPLKPIVHPLRADIPIILGAEGPKNSPWPRKSWTAGFPSSSRPGDVLLRGVPRRGVRPPGRTPDGRGLRSPGLGLLDGDQRRHRGRGRQVPSLSGGADIGGMGAKEMNFHFDVFARMGYEEAAHQDSGRLPRRPQGRCCGRRAHELGRGASPWSGRSRRSATTSRRGASRVPPPCWSTATSPRSVPWRSWSWDRLAISGG